MPSYTTYNPAHVSEFEKTKIQFAAKGVTSTLTANTTSNIDFLADHDYLLTGMQVIIKDAAVGDRVSFQAIDTTGVLGVPPGTVLQEFATDWYVPSNSNDQFDMVYPAKIFAGLTLRVVYTSTHLTQAPFFAINYKLHKVLV